MQWTTSPAACESYRQNIGDHIECRSVTEVDGKALPKAEVVIGGTKLQGVQQREPQDTDA